MVDSAEWRRNPGGVGGVMGMFPRVASLTRRPWVLGRNPFGIDRTMPL